MKVGVILDEAKLARWQADALETLATEAEFVIYSCTTSHSAKRRLRHAFYYLLNLFTIRNRMTQRVGLPESLTVVRTRAFAAPSENGWQSLPSDLLARIAADRPAVLVKLGMGLLKVPAAAQLAVPILSYHHGDPAKFRGRPAGFYELLHGEATGGQIVQILSNQLDSGRIVAAAETRLLRHSYRDTLVEAYRHSPLLLRTAVRNALAGTSWQPSQAGPVYRLPGNALVAKFIAARIGNSLTRLIYGVTREKRWAVATASIPEPLTVESLIGQLADTSRWNAVRTPSRCRFLADPFFHPESGLLVEGMSAGSGRGEILHVTDNEPRRLSGRGGHFSYPAPYRSSDSAFVVPEVSDWSSPLAYPLQPNGFGDPVELKIPGRPRLLDPTPFRHGDTVFLFGNNVREGHSVLRLWVADSLDAEFVEHSSSPIRISPNGARMAGAPILVGGDLIRVGQDMTRAYGDGISFFRVTRLDRESYAEEPFGEFHLAGRRGPHTLNMARGEMAFDYYDDGFSLLAGIRRYKERRAARRIVD